MCKQRHKQMLLFEKEKEKTMKVLWTWFYQNITYLLENNICYYRAREAQLLKERQGFSAGTKVRGFARREQQQLVEETEHFRWGLVDGAQNLSEEVERHTQSQIKYFQW